MSHFTIARRDRAAMNEIGDEFRTLACSKIVKLGSLLLLAVLMLDSGRSGGSEWSTKTDPPPRLDFSLLDTDGIVHSLRTNPEGTALVLVFISTECPIANGYLPELNRQFAAARGAETKIEFYGVISSHSTTRAVAAKHATEFKIEFPLLFDASGELADALRPTHTPEAFVVDREGQLAYRGRIDDLYADLGKKRASATCHDLADAIAALVAGQPVAVHETEPVGCFLETKLGGKLA